MANKIENSNVAVQLSGVKKMYKLGQIGGKTLKADLQSWWALKRGKEDPNTKIGEQRLYGQTFMALNGIDLTIYQGEAVGIIGGNGAGKSTLLKLLSRVTAPTEGEIDIYGRVASMLEVGTGFNGEMTGRENVYMNGAILGMTKAEIDAKMEDIIEFSEVREFIDTPVKRYSSGMYVKLAFSVAAHLDSEIMIMDEVLAVGDMAFQSKCLGKMRDAAKREGRTVLYVSHNMNTIRQLCDRCIVLDKGKIVYQGSVEKSIEVYMSMADEAQGVDINLSKRRMDHLPKEIEAKMLRLRILDKEESVYKMYENLSFVLDVEAKKEVRNLCVRLEIRATDGTSVGAGFLHDFESLKKGEQKSLCLTADFGGLVPGKYQGLLVLYEVNEWGTYNDLDAIYPAFFFEVRDTEKKLQINWNNSTWGKMKFSNLKYEKEVRNDT